MTCRAMPRPAHQDRPKIRCRPRLEIRYAILSAALGKLARPLDRFALLCCHGRIEPYEPRRVGLVKFRDALA
jgi:hypothetical protein